MFKLDAALLTFASLGTLRRDSPIEVLALTMSQVTLSSTSIRQISTVHLYLECT